MSISLKTVFPCNHIVTSTKKEYGYLKIRRNSNILFPDKFPENVVIHRIDSITLSGYEFSKNVNYNQNVSNNIIEWTSDDNNPNPLEEYEVLALYSKITTLKYNSTECERCTGNGWYSDIIYDSMTIVSGKDKLLQDVIKILFTERRGKYGSSIKDVLALNISDESDFGASVSREIESCSEQIKQMQLEIINSGINVGDSERLDKIIVKKCIFSRADNSCYVSLLIRNSLGEATSFAFKVD